MMRRRLYNFNRMSKVYMTNNIRNSFYEIVGKRVLDIVLAFLGILVCMPVFVFVSIMIFLDDPGPILFSQKRVGKGKKIFYLHKFRSMKMSAPHDMPTHLFAGSDQYITKVGKVLRKYSIDELPQIWDILIGNMSIVGPRPALWNQTDLVAERDNYSANDITPGLTGWAQVNGRDELSIQKKAKLDGEYAKILREGGWKALYMDMICFVRTIFSVLSADGVMEGEKMVRKDIDDYGYLKHFTIDVSKDNKKKVLITGAHSYIGESFERWAKDCYGNNFEIDVMDMREVSWKEKSFKGYDAVVHVAGIAHVDTASASEERKALYDKVNVVLPVETAKKAKVEGVKQFIFMSSIIIYGEAIFGRKPYVIDEHTDPAPKNFYGYSKWKADKKLRQLSEENFHVAVLRLPMVYGRNSKGNYPMLAKLAKCLPVFPNIKNYRSMLYIDNLCEFLCLLVLSGEGGIYFPQNEEYTKTSHMVRIISEENKRKIWITKLLNPVIRIGAYIPGKTSTLIHKAFGSIVYNQKLSVYDGLDYRVKSLNESIIHTEE